MSNPYTARDFAVLIGASECTVGRLIRRGIIKAHKLPGSTRTSPWRIARDELVRFRELMRTGGLSEHLAEPAE